MSCVMIFTLVDKKRRKDGGKQTKEDEFSEIPICVLLFLNEMALFCQQPHLQTRNGHDSCSVMRSQGLCSQPAAVY